MVEDAGGEAGNHVLPEQKNAPHVSGASVSGCGWHYCFGLFLSVERGEPADRLSDRLCRCHRSIARTAGAGFMFMAGLLSIGTNGLHFGSILKLPAIGTRRLQDDSDLVKKVRSLDG